MPSSVRHEMFNRDFEDFGVFILISNTHSIAKCHPISKILFLTWALDHYAGILVGKFPSLVLFSVHRGFMLLIGS